MKHTDLSACPSLQVTSGSTSTSAMPEQVFRLRAPGDHVGPGCWWAFDTVLIDGTLMWRRRWGGPQSPECPTEMSLHPW